MGLVKELEYADQRIVIILQLRIKMAYATNVFSNLEGYPLQEADPLKGGDLLKYFPEKKDIYKGVVIETDLGFAEKRFVSISQLKIRMVYVMNVFH